MNGLHKIGIVMLVVVLVIWLGGIKIIIVGVCLIIFVIIGDSGGNDSGPTSGMTLEERKRFRGNLYAV